VAIVTVTDVMALLASEGVSVGLAHCVPAVPTQACGIVIAMIAATAANERVIFSITNWFLVGSAEVKREKTSPLFETALVLVRLDHVASDPAEPVLPARVRCNGVFGGPCGFAATRTSVSTRSRLSCHAMKHFSRHYTSRSVKREVLGNPLCSSVDF